MAKCPSPKNCPKQYLTKEVRYCTQCGIDVSLIDPPGGTSRQKILIAVFAVLLLSAAAYFLIPPAAEPAVPEPDKIDKVIFTMSGSNTIGAKLAPELVKAYLKKEYRITEIEVRDNNKNDITVYGKDTAGKGVGINIRSHGSGTGFTDLKANSAELAMSSRKIKKEETNSLSGLGPMEGNCCEHAIGVDGLAIIIHPDNSVNSLTIKQLAGLFSGTPNTWTDYWPGMNEPTAIAARDSLSGTWEFFNNTLLKPNKLTLSAKSKRYESADQIVNFVSQNRNAIGFASLASVKKSKGVKVLQLQASDESAIVPLTDKSVAKEDYALTRRLLLYTPELPKADVKKFTDFVITDEGQSIVLNEGFIGTVSTATPKPNDIYTGVDIPDEYTRLTRNLTQSDINIRFASGSFDVDNRAFNELKKAASYFKSTGKRALLIGFTDNVGDEIYNKELSIKRAQAVIDILRSYGVNCAPAEGFGEAVPVGDNNTEDGKDRNRRVEIWILDK